MANKQPTPLSVMLGNGETLEVKGKTYTVNPIALKDIDEFVKSQTSVGPQFFNLIEKKSKDNINKWLEGYCVDEKGDPVTLKHITEDGWDVKDLREFMKKLCDMSG